MTHTLLECLLAGDPALARLTRKYLLDTQTPYVTQGWIGAFLERFDPQTGRWGRGIYGPKWISTFYTMRDLAALEIDPLHPIYQKGLDTLLESLMDLRHLEGRDLCVAAMFASLLAYGQRESWQILPLIRYLVDHAQPDGGWNCGMFSHDTKKSSVHTTISVLEAFAGCEAGGVSGLPEEMRDQAACGREYLLRKGLMRRETDGSLILPQITRFHFPDRWHYDVLRALLYLANARFPIDPRMNEAMDLLKDQFRRGYLLRGSAYSGLVHFPMETGRIGMMNTLRGLRVLRQYDPQLCARLLEQPLPAAVGPAIRK